MPICQSSALNGADVLCKYTTVPEPRQSYASGATARPKQTAHLLSRWAVMSPSGLMGGTTPAASALKISPDLTLRVTVGGRRRTRAVLRHELVELFLVLGVTQPIEEILEFGLLLFEAL